MNENILPNNIMDKLDQIIILQNDNNKLLNTILSKLNKQSDFKQFSLNVAADVLVELLKGNSSNS